MMKKDLTHLSARAQLFFVLLETVSVAASCSSDEPAIESPQLSAGQNGGLAAPAASAAGQGGPPGMVSPGLMPGRGTMSMTLPGADTSGGAGGPPQAAAGASGSHATANTVSSGHATAGAAGVGGVGSLAGAAASGMLGGAGAAGTPAAAGAGAPSDPMDATSVCAGGMVGMDSDAAMTRKPGGGPNLSTIVYFAQTPNKITRFVTTLTVPKVPSVRQTMFIWPGLQHTGGSDPGRTGNGVLQPVLTWGSSCNRKATSSATTYASWWISGMYVNMASAAAGPGGCASGDSMDVAVGDRLDIEMVLHGTEWTQTVIDRDTMKKVDFTIDLKGQDQNAALWDIEIPTSSRPSEDTVWDKSVLTFAEPVTSCQLQAAEVDYFSAPVLSQDGLHCCYEKIIMKQMR